MSSETELSSTLATYSAESFQKLEVDFTFLSELVVSLSAALVRTTSQGHCQGRVTEIQQLLHNAEGRFRYAKNPRLTKALSADLQAAGHRSLKKSIETEKENLTYTSHVGNDDKNNKELPAGKLKLLTPREVAILTEVVTGASSKQTARHLNISPRTVDAHRANILQKLGAKNTIELFLIVLTR